MKIMDLHLQSLLLSLLLLLANGDGNTETNQIFNNGNTEGPDLRLLKYRDIWKLALKRGLGDEKLKLLGKKLKKLDKAELDFKRQKEKGDPDYDAAAEAIIQNMLPEVLHEYGVIDEDETWHAKPLHFDDARLQSAWQLVIDEAGLSGTELRKLHEEFHTMQNRLNEYIWTVRQIDNLKEQANNNTVNDHVISNDVDGHVENEVLGEMKRLQDKIKNEFAKLDEDVIVLIKKVKTRINQEKLGELTDTRVLELSSIAEKIMLDKDLTAFKDELNYFQNRISKLRHWEKVAANLKSQLEENNFERELMDEYNYAKAKVKELQKFVKKLHSTMYGRLYKKKNEL